MHLGLGELGVLEDFLHRLHTLAEVVHVEVLETSTGDHGVEISTFEEGINLDVRLGGAGQGSLRALASSTKTTQSTLVIGDVLAELALELLSEVIDKTVIEIFSTQMSVTSSGLHFENTLLDGKKRHIESSTTKIEDQNVLLRTLLVQTVSNSSGSRLIDDTQNVHTGDNTSILSGLTLGVIEIGRDGDNCVLDLTAKVGLSDLLHLQKHHGRNLFGRELFRFALEGNVDHRLASSTLCNFERPVLHISLHNRILKFTTDKTLRIKYSVRGVHCHLVLGSITDETLGVVKSNI
mmetsp:Transcript_27016/g.45224  ORF Transcript_27016/g.45224 Transcript_27016/m.45224 type:complete len:293 (-) Transcript_27016:213-1091(-)